MLLDCALTVLHASYCALTVLCASTVDCAYCGLCILHVYKCYNPDREEH
jgi:hypothetical protein